VSVYSPTGTVDALRLLWGLNFVSWVHSLLVSFGLDYSFHDHQYLMVDLVVFL
jgi:hypothetical protein